MPKSFFTATVLIIASLLFSCNPYKKIANRIPDNHKDSARLAKACLQTFKPDTVTEIKVYYDTIFPIDSSAYYKSQVDSMLLENEVQWRELVVMYKDTCKTATAIYTKGYNAGYSTGFFVAKKTARVDTVIIKRNHYVKDTRQIQLIREELLTSEDQLKKYRKRTLIFQVSSIILLLFLLLLLYIIFQSLKRKANVS